jgi:hypothetical protein
MRARLAAVLSVLVSLTFIFGTSVVSHTMPPAVFIISVTLIEYSLNMLTA